MLIYNPEERITAKQTLSHVYFKNLVEQEQRRMMSLNDSISFIKGEDSMFINRKNSKRDRQKDSMILPIIKVYNYSIMEDSENENSKQNYNNPANIESFIKLPRIKFQFGKEKGNYLKSNEFKNSLKHNLSNHSIDNNLSNTKTQYAKSLRKRISEVKKNESLFKEEHRKQHSNIINVLKCNVEQLTIVYNV